MSNPDRDPQPIAVAMFKAWWHPFSHAAVIHGDPHLGNYTVFEEDGEAQGINLLDYGCIRIFPPKFVGGVVDLYRGLLRERPGRMVHAYETWGFKGLDKELVDILNIWAGFIYGPLLDDRVRAHPNLVCVRQPRRVLPDHRRALVRQMPARRLACRCVRAAARLRGFRDGVD
jgi:hypothetical protein